jgi:hypothetical protein
MSEFHVKAAGDLEAEFRRFAAHLRKVRGAGLEEITLDGQDLLAGKGTADKPIKPPAPAPLSAAERRAIVLEAGMPDRAAFSDDERGQAHYGRSVQAYNDAVAAENEVAELEQAVAGGESDGG